MPARAVRSDNHGLGEHGRSFASDQFADFQSPFFCATATSMFLLTCLYFRYLSVPGRIDVTKGVPANAFVNARSSLQRSAATLGFLMPLRLVAWSTLLREAPDLAERLGPTKME